MLEKESLAGLQITALVSPDQAKLFRKHGVFIGLADGGGPVPVQSIMSTRPLDYPHFAEDLLPNNNIFKLEFLHHSFSLDLSFSPERELLSKPEYARKQQLEAMLTRGYQGWSISVVHDVVEIPYEPGLLTENGKIYEYFHARLIQLASHINTRIIFSYTPHSVFNHNLYLGFPKFSSMEKDTLYETPPGVSHQLTIVGYKPMHAAV